ncbi:hypothetical protein BX666DRAFT_1917840, partial [Dichotomocladium elegans]
QCLRQLSTGDWRLATGGWAWACPKTARTFELFAFELLERWGGREVGWWSVERWSGGVVEWWSDGEVECGEVER